MKLNFDIRGNLYPATIVTIEWADFVQCFVTDFPDSITRKRLSTNFIEFINRIQQNFNQEEFKVWIDGSFVSQKLDPRDIDAVFMLDFKVCERYKSVLDNQFFIKELKFSKGLDLYYSCEYPTNHKRHFLSHLNHLYWQDVYGSTRKDDNDRQHSKGFIELKFDKKWKN